VTSEDEALARVARALDRLDIAYMVTGSVASSYHGRPRMTHDIDVVIDPEPGPLSDLVASLAADGFYVDAKVAEDALRRRSQFNAIEIETAVKIDLIVRKNRPFSVEELGRRLRVDLTAACTIALASAEDSILSKLEWARKGGGSEKQLVDVAGVVDVSGDRLDRGYIEKWARELDVLDLWERVAG
jgi:hypothetical protein